MAEHTHRSKSGGKSQKRAYSKPVLNRLDADRTATGPVVFTQEVGVFYTPPS